MAVGRPAAQATSSAASAAPILRRSLLLWGTGHLALGDRRGWLLLLLQPLAIAAVATLWLLLIDTTRWILVFPALAVLIATWLAQGVHAHQLALARGLAPGGELHIAWAMPVVLALLTAFWLAGGDHGSPAAALQEYVAAWHGGRVAEARALFTQRPPEMELAETWRAQRDYVRQRVTAESARYGPSSGLDPADPFGGLRYVELAEQRTAERAVVAVEIVRRERVETALFGVIPTATQETVLIERAGLITLRAVPTDWPAWLPSGEPAPMVWRVDSVHLPLPPPGD